jgi:hypothetical protein
VDGLFVGGCRQTPSGSSHEDNGYHYHPAVATIRRLIGGRLASYLDMLLGISVIVDCLYAWRWGLLLGGVVGIRHCGCLIIVNPDQQGLDEIQAEWDISAIKAMPSDGCNTVSPHLAPIAFQATPWLEA